MLTLDKNALTAISKIGELFTSINEIVLFGSRVTEVNNNTSDIDLAIKGNITYADILAISGLLNDESPTPYEYDVVHYETIINEEFKNQIDQHGIIIWSCTKVIE